MCLRCMIRPSLPNRRRCARCAAYRAEADYPWLTHDIDAHARLIADTHNPTAKCSVLGRSLIALRKVGDRLSIDRIDSHQGYLEGNMRLLSLELNVAKGDTQTIPQRAINRILRRLQGTVHDIYSDVPGATIPT